MKTCPRCSFGNFDHVVNCVKCGAFLDASERVSIDPNPPRAKRKHPFRERFYRFRRRIGFRWREPSERERIERDPGLGWDFKVNLFLPGFYQFRHDRVPLGIFCLGLVLGGFVCSWLLVGTGMAFFMMPCAIAGYVMSVYDANGGEVLRPFFSASGSSRLRIEWWTLLPDLLLPGFFQFRKGRFVRGAIYLGFFLTGWVLYCYAIGTLYTAWALALAAMGPALSLCDMFRFAAWPFRQRLLFTVLLSFFSFQIFHQSYFRIADAALDHEGYTTIGMEFAGTELHPGEWAIEQAHPSDLAPGDIVRMRIQGFVYGAREFFDRLLAGPGDVVSISDGRLLVNGKPGEILPLNPRYRLPNLPELTLGKDEFLIYPSAAQRGNAHLWTRNYAVVNRSQISGRLESIHFPFWRRRSLVNRGNPEYIASEPHSEQE